MFACKQWLAIGLIVVLAGCGGSSGTMMDDGAAAEDGTVVGSGSGADDSASLSGTEDDELLSGGAYEDPTAAGAALEIRVVYFAFDKADVDEASRALLVQHGDYLAENSTREIRLEGHADERGSREYNIGLGERRAQAVRQILLLRGASAAQFSTVSYGEERPAALGSDEKAWSLNRRVELVYNP
jgi:peptidoglycan-associated lipoprotein